MTDLIQQTAEGDQELKPRSEVGAAELLRDELGAVADPEHRDPEVVDAGIQGRRALDVNALRAAREDDRGGCAVLHLGRSDPVRHDFRVHPQLADTPGDQLGVLRTEVDDQNGVAV